MKSATWILAAGLALSGCGLFDANKPCDKADQAANNITEKAKGCSGIDVPEVKGKSECETALKGCSDAERVVIDEEMDCLIKLGACEAGKEQDWLKSVAACAAPVAVLSDACKKGFGL